MDSPIIASILVVIIGAVFTYVINSKIEKDRRQYEFKKHTYSEVLSVLLDTIKAWDEWREWCEQKEIENKAESSLTSAELLKKTKPISRVIFKFQLAAYKLDLCNAPKEVQDIVGERLKEPGVLQESTKAHDVIIKELIPAMKRDLNKKGWWQFWK